MRNVEADDEPIRVIHVGLGQIGAAIARLTPTKQSLMSVAAVDPAPALAGKTLADACGDGAAAVPVSASVAEALAAAGGSSGPQVAFHAVASHIPAIEAQLVELAESGLNVVSTAEELIHPHAGDGRARQAAERIDAAARACGVTIFGAGVNPGVLMDRLPAYLSSLCLRVDAIRVRRLVNLGRRRPALRRKMGVGAAVDEVSKRIAEASIGHVGLVESLQHLGACLGWRLGTVEERLAPVVAEQRVDKAGEVVEAGAVVGLDHTAEASTADGRSLALSLTMRLDTDEPFDEIEIDGEPPVHLRFPRGVAGDEATAATVLNAARFACEAPPGLITRLATPCGS